MMKFQTLGGKSFSKESGTPIKRFEVAPRCCLVVSAALQDVKKTSLKDQVVVVIASASVL